MKNEIPKNVSESTRRRNPHLYGNSGEGLRPLPAKPNQRLPLDDGGGTEEADWHNAAERFEITFTVYSMRPADYDGYDIKALQDFLVKAGVITDDRWNILAGRVVSRKAATKEEEKTVINIIAYGKNASGQ